jgi:glycoside/pentoside/hexuronide:cation symporter, GPH family
MKKTQQAEAAEPEFTLKEGLAYLAGAIGIQLTTTMVATWAAIFYSPPQGSHRTIYMSIGLATAMMTVGQIFNAVSAPIVGLWSDRTRGRLGRRRPFIIFGSIPLVLVFFLIWTPPDKGPSPFNFAWGLLFVILYFWAVTAVMIPYIALMPEIARTTEGRVKIGVFNALGMIIGLVLGISSGILIEAIGVKITALIFGFVSLACFQITGWVVKERFVSEIEIEKQTLKEIFAQLAGTLKNRPFMIFFLASMIFNLGFYVIQIALPDFTLVILKKNEDFVTYLFIPFLLVCLPLTFAVESIVKKWNKKLTYAAGMFGFAILFPFIGVVGLIPNPTLRMVLLFTIVGIAGAPQAINYVMAGAMIGEISDYDEIKTGKRQEAVYSGAWTFGLTTSMALGYLVRWGVYAPFGKFAVHNTIPVMLIGPVTGVISLIGFLIFLKYPILHVVKGEEK